MIVPRDYQNAALTLGQTQILNGSQGVLCRLPTGAGKTVVGSLYADWWLSRGRDYRVLVLSHERQLVWQFADEIEELLGLRPGIEMAGEKVNVYSMPPIVVSCRASLAPREGKSADGTTVETSRLLKFDPRFNWLLILDEVHRWAYKLPSCAHILRHFEQNPKSSRLGLTATPLRGDGVSLSKVCPDVAADYRLFDINGGRCAVRDGWAVGYDQRFITVEGVDFKNLKEVARDFDQNELDAILSERTQMLSLVKPLLELVGSRRCIVFCPGVGTAKLVAHTIDAEIGRESALSLHGGVPEKIRQKIYNRHKAGDFQFLCVCGLCREGYNDPGIQAVACFRPTKSRSLAEQMKGRGCRPLRGLVDGLNTSDERRAAIAASAKPNCMIIDLVGITGLADCASTAHILAAGKPDEVIERANANALKLTGPVDMAEQIQKAEAEIEQEKAEEFARRFRAAADREISKRIWQLKEDAERARVAKTSKLQADVRFSQEAVRQGTGVHVEQPQRSAKSARMLFGKYKGKPVSELPTWYLEHTAQWSLPQWLRSAIDAVLGERKAT